MISECEGVKLAQALSTTAGSGSTSWLQCAGGGGRAVTAISMQAQQKKMESRCDSISDSQVGLCPVVNS